jgi:tRNA pseudouridine55 synthase
MPSTTTSRRRVDGVVLLDKPTGLTSNAALMRAKRLFNAEKAGHTGTLDPLASGLLPICFGVATRFAQFLLDAPKRYVATVRFGTTTTTQDAEGEVVASRPVTLRRDDVEAVLPHFLGTIAQTPPAHSALKFRGVPHYEYARRGVDVPRVPREITIHRLVVLDWRAPDATLYVECSKGTYVRALAADLGAALGCGAHLAALRRTVSGGFDIAEIKRLTKLFDPRAVLAAVERGASLLE